MSSSSSESLRSGLTEPLHRVLGWMRRTADSTGALICPFHRIEHTGKSAGALLLACHLAELDPSADREDLLAFARGQGERLCLRLEREGDSTCFTFRPGRHDPYNCSNSVIDGGACSDALAELVRVFGAQLSDAERERFIRASVLSAQTYLRYCVFDKGIPAQKAWALTGVAQAYALSRHEVLRLTVTEGTELLSRLTRRDGSVPYHPVELGAGHPGASDTSAFYQSRVTAFLGFALERSGVGLEDAGARALLERQIAFLLGLVGPDGIKPGLVEAKPWYWGATYEVASHPFDMAALAVGHRLLGDARCLPALRASWEAWVDHLQDDGEPRSHLPGPGRTHSYQCPFFWASHASWAARALPSLEAAYREGGSRSVPPGLTWFPEAQLGRLEGGGVAAWVRGARPAGNLNHGSRSGAGLLRVVQAKTGEELLARCRLGAHAEGEWTGRFGGLSLMRGWATHKDELRFSLWQARHAARGRGLRAAAAPPWGVMIQGLLAYAGPRVSTAFDRSPAVEIDGKGLRLEVTPSRRDGRPWDGGPVERVFSVDDAGLLVEERLLGPTELHYQVPRRATGVERSKASVRWRLRG